MSNSLNSNNLIQSKRLVPIAKEMIVQCNEKISGFDQFGFYSTATMMYFPYVVTSKQGKFLGIVSKTDIQRHFFLNKDCYKTATFGDVANRNAERYYLNNLPLNTKHKCTIVNNHYDEPIMFYFGADRFISSVFIDIIDACNLHCPNCLRGCQEIPNSSDKMSLEDFENIIKNFSGQYGIRSFSLFNWMEPFLANDLHKYFDVLDKYDCKGNLSSNLSLKNDNLLKNVITHNALNNIMISVSGYTSDVQRIYHRGSDINIIKSNLEFISKLKTQRPLENFLFVKFLKFDYNESDIPLFKKYAENLGLAFCVFNGWGDLASFNIPQVQRKLKGGIVDSFSLEHVDINYCCSMFNQIVINAKCDIYTCCNEPTISKLKIGNFYTDTIEDVFIKKLFYQGCKSCIAPKNIPMNDDVYKILSNAIKLKLNFSTRL